jgi:hypothetical protein
VGRLRRAGVTAVAIAAIAGCASIRVETAHDPAADFSALHRYAWLAESQPSTGDPRLDDAELDAQIRGAVDGQLAKRGLSRVEAAAADFLVAYFVAVEQKRDVESIYRSYGRAQWGGGGVGEAVVREYEEGTLLIDFLHPATGSLLWRGTAAAEIRERRSSDAVAAYVNRVVDEILSRYPPG